MASDRQRDRGQGKPAHPFSLAEARYGRSMATINDARLREILTGSPTVAVLGIHREPDKAAFYVPEYLHDEGYRVIGVNPEFVGETLFGEKVRATLRELGEPIDLEDAGITVIQNRCTLADHQRLGLGKPAGR